MKNATKLARVLNTGLINTAKNKNRQLAKLGVASAYRDHGVDIARDLR